MDVIILRTNCIHFGIMTFCVICDHHSIDQCIKISMCGNRPLFRLFLIMQEPR